MYPTRKSELKVLKRLLVIFLSVIHSVLHFVDGFLHFFHLLVLTFRDFFRISKFFVECFLFLLNECCLVRAKRSKFFDKLRSLVE